MFWKRKQHKITPSGQTTQPLFDFLNTPARKEFVNMYDLLKEAERFDNIEEFGLSDDILTILVKCIENYKSVRHES